MNEKSVRKILDVLVCPLTKTGLLYDSLNQELISLASKLAFPVREGIPIVIVDEARTLSNEEVQKISDTLNKN